ncbi:MAG: YhcN/YlaJ family sporulation lipoprotein [Clostridiales bacterium]|nr:YhcN/YlaJ family sporulation lipoprotein [Clostridiales bacterium]
MKPIKLAAAVLATTMGMGLVGCGNMDSTTSRAPQNGNYPQQVRMDIEDSNDMMKNSRYNTTNRGKVVGYSYKNDLTKGNNYSSSYGKNYSSNYSKNYGNDSNYNNSSDLSRTEKIQNELNKLNGYSDMTCVVNGDTAIVGCTPNTANNAQYRSEIINTVRECDPSINKCEVVNTKDGVSKISTMAENMRKGNMMSTISEDFKKMWKDIAGY